jgi:hypothetical protein
MSSTDQSGASTPQTQPQVPATTTPPLVCQLCKQSLTTQSGYNYHTGKFV